MQGFQKIFATFTSDQFKSIKSQIENGIKIAEGTMKHETMVVLDDISQSSVENTRGSSGKKSTKKRSLKAIHGMFLEWSHLSTAVAWREKKSKHFVFNKYFSLVLGVLKSKISKK